MLADELESPLLIRTFDLALLVWVICQSLQFSIYFQQIKATVSLKIRQLWISWYLTFLVMHRMLSRYVVLNRPWAVVQWLRQVNVKERYILMSEPDHIWVKPMPNLMMGEKPASFPFFYIEPASAKNLPLVEKFTGEVDALASRRNLAYRWAVINRGFQACFELRFEACLKTVNCNPTLPCLT